MNLQSELFEIKEVLQSHRPFWFEEILNYYPQTLDYYPDRWIDSLDKLSPKDLWRVDSKRDFSSLKGGGFYDLLKQLEQLTKVTNASRASGNDYPDWAYKQVKHKKRHEINKLIGTIDQLNSRYNFSHAVDIGGGVGHLARILSHYYALPTLSLDANRELQVIGKRRMVKFPKPKNASCATFLNMKFGDKTYPDYQKKLEIIFNENALTIGLHTCGCLANEHFSAAIKYGSKGIINLGCCYAKLDTISDINISSYSKQNPLELSTHALTLASRAHSGDSWAGFLLKERVKSMRYAFHLFLYHELNIKNFMSVGNYATGEYWHDFSSYAKTKMAYLNLDCDIPAREFSLFFNSIETKKMVRKMFLANIIRWQFGRLVEKYVLLDRTLFLNENGYNTQLLEIFDATISPRNLGILAIRS